MFVLFWWFRVRVDVVGGGFLALKSQKRAHLAAVCAVFVTMKLVHAPPGGGGILTLG